MSKAWEPKKATVELQQPQPGSRIRRDPVRSEPQSLVKADWHTREREIAIAIAGVILFAIALNLIWFGVNAFVID